jgi:hypothetical protein
MNETITTKNSPTKEDISLLASHLWENSGRPCGRDVEFWLEAETKLSAVTSGAAKTAAANPAISMPKTSSTAVSFLKFGKKRVK